MRFGIGQEIKQVRVTIRPGRIGDQPTIAKIARSVCSALESHCTDPVAFSSWVGNLSSYQFLHEAYVAETEIGPVAVVHFIPSWNDKPDCFDLSVPLIRYLFVPPGLDTHEFTRRLLEVCIWRARRDGNSSVAIHATPIMSAELELITKMGFEFVRAAPAIHGIPFNIYSKKLSY
ncbi:hypothetical protein [uncultured Roseibium sp.]|uniref:hypothetical protein n=1 Tax=uncultured Roseibium sp. TaxID=1936171 RepID=UPI00261DEB37|nr:hypothetical protein [uncultured Roseibium sp.]